MDYQKREILDLVKPNPAEYSVHSLADAYSYCKQIATSHYENFPVGSILIPKKNRKFFYAVYAYSRLGDDIGDEHDFDKSQRLELLNNLENTVRTYVESNEVGGNPVALALADTIQEKQIPVATAIRLLQAFRQDVNFVQPTTISDLEQYSHYSANPVGELVLYISDEFNPKALKYSNLVCTGLQLINFWQDLSLDLKINRIYIPSSLLKKHNLNPSSFENSQDISIEAVDSVLSELFELTRSIMTEGSKITNYVKNRRLRAELTAIIGAATIVLEKCESMGSRLLLSRPKLNKSELIRLIPKVSLTLLKR